MVASVMFWEEGLLFYRDFQLVLHFSPVCRYVYWVSTCSFSTCTANQHLHCQSTLKGQLVYRSRYMTGKKCQKRQHRLRFCVKTVRQSCALVNGDQFEPKLDKTSRQQHCTFAFVPASTWPRKQQKLWNKPSYCICQVKCSFWTSTEPLPTFLVFLQTRAQHTNVQNNFLHCPSKGSHRVLRKTDSSFPQHNLVVSRRCTSGRLLSTDSRQADPREGGGQSCKQATRVMRNSGAFRMANVSQSQSTKWTVVRDHKHLSTMCLWSTANSRSIPENIVVAPTGRRGHRAMLVRIVSKGRQRCVLAELLLFHRVFKVERQLAIMVHGIKSVRVRQTQALNLSERMTKKSISVTQKPTDLLQTERHHNCVC